MGFTINRAPSDLSQLGTEHRIIDLTTDATTETTLATANSPVEVLAADVTATHGRFIYVENAGASGEVRFLGSGTTFAEGFFPLAPMDSFTWDVGAGSLKAISETAGAIVKVVSWKYGVN